MAAHPHLTLTRLYNVLAAIRAGVPLSPAERDIHDAGEVTILRTLHDRLDAAVSDAYGWPRDLSDAEIVALNAVRVAEEAAGKVRWLRPAYQAPTQAVRAQQPALAVDSATAESDRRWPKDEPAQFVALRAALRDGPMAAPEIARRFKGTPRGDRLPGRATEFVSNQAVNPLTHSSLRAAAQRRRGNPGVQHSAVGLDCFPPLTRWSQ